MERSLQNLIKRLEASGVPESEFRGRLLPDWWADECEYEVGVLMEIEIGVAAYLQCSYNLVRNYDEKLPAKERVVTCRICNKSLNSNESVIYNGGFEVHPYCFKEDDDA